MERELLSAKTPGPSCSEDGQHYPADSVVCFAIIYPLDSVIHPLNNQVQIIIVPNFVDFSSATIHIENELRTLNCRLDYQTWEGSKNRAELN